MTRRACMPSKKKPAPELPTIPQELIDQFVTGPMSAEAVQAASMAFKKALIERDLGAEMSHHLGYARGAARAGDMGNHRNGRNAKTVLTEDGPLEPMYPVVFFDALRVKIREDAVVRNKATHVRIFSSGTDQRLTNSLAPPSPAKKLWTTSSLNSVVYF